MRKNIQIGLLLAGATGLFGCVPEWDEAPLTPTGEAGEVEKVGVGGTGGATGCSGEFAGMIQANNNSEMPTPCIVASVDVRTPPSEATIQLLRGIKTVKGTLRLGAGLPLATYFPALTSVGMLEVSGTGGNLPILAIPSKITSLNSLQITNSDISEITGGGGLTAIPGGIEIVQNSDLTSIKAFAKVASTQNLVLSDLPKLKTLEAFAALKSANNILINQLDSLTTIPAIDVVSVNDGIEVSYCDSLQTVAAFRKVEKLNRLNLSYNANLKVVSFPALGEVNNFNLSRNGSMQSIGFENTKVKSSYQICLVSVSCADRLAWIAKNAATAQEGKCQPISEMCF